MNLIFISTGSHPDHQAAAIRQSTIGKGLIELNVSIDFFVLTFQNWKGKTMLYNKIRYQAFNTYSGQNRIVKKYYIIKSFLLARKQIKKRIRENTVDGLLIFPDKFLLGLLIIPLAKRYDIPLFHERTELPYTVLGDSYLEKINYFFYTRWMLKQFDGIFIINDRLGEYISKFNKHVKKLLTVVDPDFFSKKETNPFSFPYIGYCGKMSGTKDGVPVLIEAFSMISPKYPELRLVLIGDNSDKNAILETLQVIDTLELDNKVIFTGSIERCDMPRYLGNAEVLAVAKPSNEQNSGNFPIKIGEYLATGVPVVATSVGEIAHFIKDGITGFLSKSDSPSDFSSKLDEALSDKQRAISIGRRGKELAHTTFNYKVQAREMLTFIEITKNGKSKS